MGYKAMHEYHGLVSVTVSNSLTLNSQGEFCFITNTTQEFKQMQTSKKMGHKFKRLLGLALGKYRRNRHIE